MGQIFKGKIASIDGNMARVVPLDEGAKPTTKIVIPWHLRGRTGELKKGTEVIYVEFADSSGLLLGRVDGNWGEYLPYLESELVETPRGDVVAQDVSLHSHIHGGVQTGGGNTSTPE